MTAIKGIGILFILYLLSACSADTGKRKDSLRSQYDSCHNCINDLFRISPAKALGCAKTEIELGKTIEDNHLILTGYLDTSRALFLLRQYETALEYAHKALELNKDLDDQDTNAEAKRICGAIYTNLDHKEYAWKYLDEALEYYVSRKDTNCMIRTLGTKAISLGQDEQYDACIRTFQKVYELSKQQNNYEMMLITLLNLVNAYSIADKVDESFGILDSIRTQIPAQFITAKDSITIHSYLGELLFKQKKYSQAKKILQETVQQTRLYHDYEVLQSSLKSLIKIAKEENDFVSSSLYFDEVFNIQDSIASMETKNRVSEMEIVFDVARKDAEIEKLIMQNRWNKQKLLLIIIILVSIVTFILIRTRSNARLIAIKAQLLDKELANKREELTNLAIYHYEQKRMIDNLYKNLKQASNASEDTNTRKILNNIYAQIIKVSVDGAETKINDYIDSRYKDFIAKINTKYPDLSDREKRICAMLLVDFSTKEISEVLNISDRSINNIRSKIRKKMNIPEDNSIPNFLKEL